MPGLDKSRFSNLRECDDELLCGICLAIFVEPLVTPCCQQTYCSDCINEWLRTHSICPNDRTFLIASNLLKPQRLVYNILDKLEIKCDFYVKGCEQKLTLQQLTNHVKTCRYNPEVICVVCGELTGDYCAHCCLDNVLDKNKRLEACNKDLEKCSSEWFTSCEKLITDHLELNRQIKRQLDVVKHENTSLIKVIKRLRKQKVDMNKKHRSSNWFINKLLTKE